MRLRKKSISIVKPAPNQSLKRTQSRCGWTAYLQSFGGASTTMMGNSLTMMHNIWTAARSVLAVLAGIVALTAVAFAIEIPPAGAGVAVVSPGLPGPSRSRIEPWLDAGPMALHGPGGDARRICRGLPRPCARAGSLPGNGNRAGIVDRGVDLRTAASGAALDVGHHASRNASCYHLRRCYAEPDQGRGTTRRAWRST